MREKSTGRVTPRMRLALASFAAVVIAAGAVPGAFAAAERKYRDGARELGGGPDIGKVTITQEDDLLTVDAEVANMPELFETGIAAFVLDTDGDPTTGEIGGGDYILWWDIGKMSGFVERWNGAKYVHAKKARDPSRTLIGGNSVGFMFNLANFRWPKRIELAVLVSNGGSVDPATTDVAPDRGRWAFAVHPSMESLELEFGQELPRAGAVFGVKSGSLELSDGRSVTPRVFSCTAMLGGVRLAGLGRQGACRWQIPANAAGKRFTLDMTVTHLGDAADFGTWKFRVASRQ